MNRTRTQQVHSVLELLAADIAQHHERLTKLLPAGTPVSWTTSRNGKVYRHYGATIWPPNRQDLSISVVNDKTGKTTRLHASPTYGFQVEDA